jgi:hypothetical protein
MNAPRPERTSKRAPVFREYACAGSRGSKRAPMFPEGAPILNHLRRKLSWWPRGYFGGDLMRQANSYAWLISFILRSASS